jgi:DNA-directed RNA polymerase II subunit RPB2
MSVSRHLFDTYFKDTPNALTRHHLDSYNDLISNRIINFTRGMNPLSLDLGDNRAIRVYVGGKTGNDLFFVRPSDEIGNAIYPHQCRLDNKSYTVRIHANITLEYVFEDEVVTQSFDDVNIAELPLMLKSSLCNLFDMTPEQLFRVGECKFELGGYFIIDGAEKALLTQEVLAPNMFYASKRIKVSTAAQGGKTLVEKETESKLVGSAGEKYEYIAAIRSSSEDGTKGPSSHFLIIPPQNDKPDDPEKIAKFQDDFAQLSSNRLATITLPGFTQPIPVISVFYALGLVNDRDIYDTTLIGIPDSERSIYDEIFSEIFLSHDKFVEQERLKETDRDQDMNFVFLKRQTRTRSAGAVFICLYEKMFPHCELHTDESQASFFRRKSYLLGYMLKQAMDVAIGKTGKTDRDHLQFKRLHTSGELLFQEFRKIYNETGSRFLTEMDKRVHFEKDQYRGKKLLGLVSEENIGYYWRSTNFLYGLEKSFKGKWGGKDGVSQELMRLSYLGTAAQLRRVNLDMDKGGKNVEMRRIHGSSWGLLCPSDNPDGRNIGMLKSLTVLCSISTPSPSVKIYEYIQKNDAFLSLNSINPSIWNPSWTRVYLNSDLIGVLTHDAERFHKQIRNSRRSGELDKFVSLSWKRISNEYFIYTDSGRPLRPIYREKTSEYNIINATSWREMISEYIDYIDAAESENLRISLNSFSDKYPSEIHGLTILSATASALPNCDSNPGTRNAFSCQQVKQACGWYNTAFSKRFDTVATWLNYAQRPISQTWTFRHILGCLPYGETPIVALMIYSGYNQEDSVILNDSSLKRGMFHTTYYHSYEYVEETSNSSKTVFGFESNPTLIKKEGYDYSNLDSDGIIKPGSHVKPETILVGMVTNVSDLNGVVVSNIDVSKYPKRGQHGMVDSVYKYVTSEGLRAVKIRIAEHRVPTLGDKFSARHGQKGTVGIRMLEKDMPFTSGGMRPDMIVNPHAFPSRMTVGQFVESISSKLGIYMGALVDATPFTAQNRVEEVSTLMKRAGFHPYGNEIMYNGENGEMLESEIFIAPTYYIRSKLMVEDKINYRTTGPRKLLTHQPAEGRANDGGLRIGEMERDCLLSHGISKFLNESLMERSDKTDILFQPESGRIHADTKSESLKLTTPYSLKLAVQEMESMHISVNLIDKSRKPEL